VKVEEKKWENRRRGREENKEHRRRERRHKQRKCNVKGSKNRQSLLHFHVNGK
jgi:hypothetical protein